MEDKKIKKFPENENLNKVVDTVENILNFNQMVKELKY